MKYALTVVFSAALLFAPSAFAITKCLTADGQMVFTDTECPPGGQPAGKVQYKAPPPPARLREGERRMLNNIEAREREDRAYKRYQYDQDKRHHVGYGDRQEIKKLERRKRRLSEQLQRSDPSYGQASAIRSEIRGIDRQIEQIRAPKW